MADDLINYCGQTGRPRVDMQRVHGKSMQQDVIKFGSEYF